MSTSAATAAVAAPEFLVLPAVWDSQLELFLEALSSPLLLRNPASPPSALGLLKPSVARRRSLEHRAQLRAQLRAPRPAWPSLRPAAAALDHSRFGSTSPAGGSCCRRPTPGTFRHRAPLPYQLLPTSNPCCQDSALQTCSPWEEGARPPKGVAG